MKIRTITRLVGYSLLAAAFYTGGMPGSTTALSACQRPTVTAHRGFVNKYHTENTYRALNAAARRNADSIEFDIRTTADHQWVLMHDATVDRTTNGTGSVGSMTYDQIQSLKVNDSGATGVVHRVPSFSKVLRLAALYPKLNFQIEFKGVTTGISDTELTDAITMINDSLAKERVLITSSEGATLARIKQLDPGFAVGLIIPTKSRVPTFKQVKSQHFDYLNVAYTKVSKNAVKKAHKAGLNISVRGANNKAQWKAAVSKSPDNMVMDNFVGYDKWCK